MSKINSNDVEITLYTDDSMDVEFSAAITEEQAEFLVKSFETKGFFESTESNSGKEVLGKCAWELSKALGDPSDASKPSKPPSMARVMGEHRAKMRAQERTARMASSVPKQVPSTQPTPSVKPASTPRADGMPLAGGIARPYALIPDKPNTVTKKSEDEVVKFNHGGQWSIEKSNCGPKGAGLYNPADNARRKMNNTDNIDSLGNMGRVKDYGPSNPKAEMATMRRLRALNRKQPVRTAKDDPKLAQMMAERNAAIKEPVTKSWTEHKPFPSANQPAKEVLKTAEDAMPQQLANLLLNKSILGPVPPAQPSDAQMFGHLAVSQEQADAAKNSWDNTFNSFYDAIKKPAESQDLSKSWGNRGRIENETLSEEEERIRNIPVANSEE